MKPRAIVVASALAIAVFSFSPPVSMAQTASMPDPFPPRMFFTTGFTGSNAYTLLARNGYLTAGYPGADLLAQVFSEDDVTSLPLIIHAAYGVTDYFTLGLGSGFWRFEYETFSISETNFYPYLAPKLRLYNGELLTSSIQGIIVLPTEKDFDGFLYGYSLGLSTNMAKRAAGHLSIGVAGFSIADEHNSEGVFAIGGDALMFMTAKGQFKFFGEFRRVGFDDDGFSILTAGARFLTNTLGVEAGFAHWFEEDFDARPIVSASYRF